MRKAMDSDGPSATNTPGGPLYQQVARKLRAQILDGTFPADSALPNEDQLAAEHAVSRVTIRKALEFLAGLNLIRRQQGKGTFVNPLHMRQHLSRRAQTITEALREKGVEPKVTVLGLEHRPLPSPYNEWLGLGDREGVVLRRLYTHQGDPIALVTLYLPLPMSGVAYALAKRESGNETSYSIFEDQMGVVIKEANHVIRTVQIDDEESVYLGLPAGTVCLAMDRITYSTQGTVLELMHYVYAPDRMEFEINLPRRSASDVVIRKVFQRTTAEEPDPKDKIRRVATGEA
jgi:GntR family transcriptional regulator